MKKVMATGLTAAAVLGTAGTGKALSLTVDQPELTKAGATIDGTPLVNAILGSGITLVGTPAYRGATTAPVNGKIQPLQAGIFSGGKDAGIGINSGIILSTGLATDAVKKNSKTALSTSFYNSWAPTYSPPYNQNIPGDSDLRRDFYSAYPNYEASVLQFSFTPQYSADLYMKFVFASDEYNEYANTLFTDVFAFYLDKNKNHSFEANENIALIPDPNIPSKTTNVSVNTVNAGRPPLWADPKNSAYFNNNDPVQLASIPCPDFPYDGFTVPLRAHVTGLSIGQEYSIKLVIADVNDRSKDSAVFIGAGSFSYSPFNTNPTPEPATIFLLGSGLLAAGATFRRKKS